MGETAEKLKAELASLPAEDREELAEFLYDTLEPETGDDREDKAEFVAELMRRLEDIKSGKDPGQPAAQVIKEIREKYL